MTLPLLKNQKNLGGKRILLRLDLNVSISDGQVTEDFRIKRSMPTLEFLVAAGAQVMIISHLDEKEGKSLEPVAKYLVKKFPKLRFVRDIYNKDSVNERENLRDGGIILFENIRGWRGEKDNDPEFAKYLASFADIFVNDAFSASHRKHASIVGIPMYLPSCIGLLFEEEVKELSKAFSPSRPFLFILGGAKFETKIPLLEKFLPLADNIFVGGAIANDFFLAKGYFVGDSLVSDKDYLKSVDFREYLGNPKIILPIDCRTQHRGFFYNKSPNHISVHERIYDVGEKSTKELAKYIKDASLIIWNGPMGNIEAGALSGTLEIAKAISESNAKSIMGGGDSISALRNTEYFAKFSFVSSGGGAMLDFLANETLPGMDAISKNYRRRVVTKPKSWFRRLFS